MDDTNIAKLKFSDNPKFRGCCLVYSDWESIWIYARPHPGPLPRGEGETLSRFKNSGTQRLNPIKGFPCKRFEALIFCHGRRVVEFEPDVIVHNSARQAAAGDGEFQFVGAGFHQGRVEGEIAFAPGAADAVAVDDGVVDEIGGVADELVVHGRGKITRADAADGEA